MAYGLPVRGQSDWDDELNNSMEALRADVQSAVADTAVARSDATYARNRADEVHTAVLGAPDAAVAALVNDTASATSAALSATYAPGVAGRPSFGVTVGEGVRQGIIGARTHTDLGSLTAVWVGPVTNNRNGILDIGPKGTPIEDAGNGISWFDVCDADALDTNPPIGTARVGIFSDHVEFGSRMFNAGTVKPVWFTIDGVAYGKLATDGQFTLRKDTAARYTSRVQNASTADGAYVDTVATANACDATLRAYSSGFTAFAGAYASAAQVDGSGAGGVIVTASLASGKIRLLTDGYDPATNERVQITSGGLDIKNSGVLKVAATQVVGARKTGWAAATGTATRTTFATGSVTLPQLAERVKALVDDLISHGLIGV